MNTGKQFADRTEAGKALGKRLLALKLEQPVVLALPRGGVPVAAEIARALHAPLDLVLVRKIGVPYQRELAVAAVVNGSGAQIVVNEDVAALIGIDRKTIDELAKEELAEIERRRRLYLGGRIRETLEGRDLIVVDDGIATGASVRAAIQALRRSAPRRIILAVPVAPRETVVSLSKLVDDVICLEIPDPFYAIGLHYEDFHQVPDDEVMQILREIEGETLRSGPSQGPEPESKSDT
jgi:putative phosphoribosyl transferase